jgi:neutral ceramidase
MKCGTSQVCITPPVGVELSGYAARVQPSVGVLDDLYVRGLYLEEGQEQLLWLHADLIGFDGAWVRALCRALAAAFGLHERQILISATHTHSGPATVTTLRETGAVDAAFMAGLADHFVSAARVAVSRPDEATLHFGEGACTLAADRRPISPNSHMDPALPVLSWLRGDGSCAAILANYAMHNTALGPDNRHISGDVGGLAAAHIREGLPDTPTVLFTNGGCGNVNPPAQTPDYRVTQQFGRRLGNTVVYTVKTGMTGCADASLASALATVRLPYTIMTPAEVVREHERAVAECVPELLFWQRARRAYDQWRDETLAALASGCAPAEVEVDLQVVKIGPVSFVAIPGEVFSRLATDLRTLYNPRTYVVGYANGDIGYLPPAEVYAEGGYEVNMAYKFYGSNFMVAAGSFELLRERARRMLQS